MRHLQTYLTVLIGVWAIVLFLAGCSPEASQPDSFQSNAAAVGGGSVELALLAPNDTATVTATPAPSGFVPGDSLPALEDNTATTPVVGAEDETGYQELTWEELVPPGYRAEDIMVKYRDQLNVLQDGDPAAMEIYQQMQEEFNNAPINGELNQLNVRLPGFIAPLEFQDGLITTFLLVPYFGACIHVPPPPINQTVYVTLAEGNGIIPGDSYYPFWVEGTMLAQAEETDIGAAGYLIEGAVVELYTYESP